MVKNPNYEPYVDHRKKAKAQKKKIIKKKSYSDDYELNIVCPNT